MTKLNVDVIVNCPACGAEPSQADVEAAIGRQALKCGRCGRVNPLRMFLAIERITPTGEVRRVVERT